MDFDLNADQLALRDGARDLLDGRADAAAVRRFTESDQLFDRNLWDAMVEQGWLCVEQDEADGGLGLGPVEQAVMLEEIGRHVAPVPVLSTVLAARACARAGFADVAAALTSGERIGCVAWSRRADAVVAEPRRDEWLLSGRPDPTPYAPAADVAIVLAAEGGDGAVGVFLVELSDETRPAREPAMDVTRPLGWLELSSTPAACIGDADDAVWLLDRAAALTAAEMLGAASRALDMSVEYARERVQFGRPIGSFQAVKHRCADMLVDVEGMRSTAYWAAWSLDADHPERTIAAATAKIWAGDAAKRVMASALQVHGGIGFTWEHDLHFFLKRSQLDQVSFGDASFHRARLGAILRARALAGDSVI
jgi:alkylation response protein AidB-like acyl-CoA dehydrogenase